MSTPRSRLLLALLALSVLAAACSDTATQEEAEDLVGVGTEAWIDGEAPLDPYATALPVDPTAQDPTAQDPAAQDPTAGNGVGADSDGAAVPDTQAAPVDPSGGIDAVVAAMTLEQKVGQLFVVPVVGDDATGPSQDAVASNMALYGVPTPAEVVSRYHLGGVAYFAHDQGPGTSNVGDLSRTVTLSTGLQAAAAADTGIGLLIGTDQEGGPVVRLEEPAVVFPSARDIASTGDTDLARQVGVVTGSQALAVGVNWVYAPVADVNVNPDNPVIGDRAFGVTAEATLALRPGHRLGAGRRRRAPHAEALPRPRRHLHRQPQLPPDDRPRPGDARQRGLPALRGCPDHRSRQRDGGPSCRSRHRPHRRPGHHLRAHHLGAAR